MGWKECRCSCAEQPGEAAHESRSGVADEVGHAREREAQHGRHYVEPQEQHVRAQDLAQQRPHGDDDQHGAGHGQQPGPGGQPFDGVDQVGQRLVAHDRHEKSADDESRDDGPGSPRRRRAGEAGDEQHRGEQREPADGAPEGRLRRRRVAAQGEAQGDQAARVDDGAHDEPERRRVRPGAAGDEQRCGREQDQRHRAQPGAALAPHAPAEASRQHGGGEHGDAGEDGQHERRDARQRRREAAGPDTLGGGPERDARPLKPGAGAHGSTSNRSRPARRRRPAAPRPARDGRRTPRSSVVRPAAAQ